MNTEKIIEFLVTNGVAFQVPGCYSMPKKIIIKSIQEFLETGKSDLINKHKKWTWYCWDFEYMKKGDKFKKLTLEELEEFKKLKLFWEDYEDIKILEQFIDIGKIDRKIQKSYKYKRKIGFSVEIKRSCKTRDNYRCLKCNTTSDLEIDHIIPIIKGGNNELDNAQTLCKKCHRFKTSKDLKR